MMKIAVTTYSFYQYLSKGKMTQLDTIKVAKELGFEAIDFNDLKPNTTPTLEEQLEYAKLLRAEAEKYDLPINSYTVGADLFRLTQKESADEVARLKGQVDVAVALGAKLMRHDICHREKHSNGKVISFGKMLPTIADNARQITEYAASKGIPTCTENHGYVGQDSDRLETLYNTVNHENYGILLDIGNFACVGEDSVHGVSRLASYAIHVHAKDFKIYPYGATLPEGAVAFPTRCANMIEGCIIGEGDVPVKQCLAILKRAGYDGYVTIEYEGNEDCIEGLKASYKNLKAMIEELG